MLAYWARKYGKNDLVGKVVRVETPKEVREVQELRKRVRQLEKALVDAEIDRRMERAYVEIACRAAGIKDVDEFKKKVLRERAGDISLTRMNLELRKTGKRNALSAHALDRQWHGRKIEEQSRLCLDGLQIRPNDGEVHGLQGFDGLEFHYDAIGNKQIESMLPNGLAPVGQADRLLALEGQVSGGQLNTECLLVDGLQESRSQIPVNRNGRTDNARRQFLIRQLFAFTSHISCLPEFQIKSVFSHQRQ
jgi:hypothetical protein